MNNIILAKIRRKLNIKQNKLANDMIISGLCKPLSMIVSYMYVPLSLNYLGVEKYGIWVTILSILSWIGYFDIGVGNGLRNKLAESLSKKNGESNVLVSSAYAIITLIVFIVTLIFCCISMVLDWNKIFKINNIDENLHFIIITSLCFTAVNFVLSLCKSVMFALHKASSVSIIELMIQFLNLCAMMVFIHIFERKLFIMALVYGLAMTIINMGASIILFSKNAEVRPHIYDINLFAGKNIASLGVQFFVIQICALILFTTDSILVAYLYGASDVTPYNTVNKLYNVIVGIHTALITPVWSYVTKLKTIGNYNAIRELIKKLFIVMIPFIMGTLMLMSIFRPITRFWLGKDLAYTTPLIILGAIYCLLMIWCNTFAAISNGMQIMKISMFFACIQAIVNIPLSLYLAKEQGLESAGILGGTCGAMMIAAIVSPYIVNKELNRLENGRT